MSEPNRPGRLRDVLRAMRDQGIEPRLPAIDPDRLLDGMPDDRPCRITREQYRANLLDFFEGNPLMRSDS